MQDDKANGSIHATEQDRRYSAPALEKGLDILELLSEVRVGLSLADLADRLTRTKSEIFRMVAVLNARGYIERLEGQDRYIVTDKMFRLGLRRPALRSLLDAALPLMNAYADLTGYSCHLAVASHTQMVVVARVESTSHIGFTVRIGYRQPLVVTGSGHCLLAFMTARRRIRTLEAIRAEDTWVNIDALIADLDVLRRTGYVIRESGIAEGVTDISCPIIDRSEGGAVAALTTPYIRVINNPIEKEELAVHLHEVVGRISSSL